MNRAGVAGHLEPCTVSSALPQGSLCDLEGVLCFHSFLLYNGILAASTPMPG